MRPESSALCPSTLGTAKGPLPRTSIASPVWVTGNASVNRLNASRRPSARTTTKGFSLSGCGEDVAGAGEGVTGGPRSVVAAGFSAATERGPPPALAERRRAMAFRRSSHRKVVPSRGQRRSSPAQPPCLPKPGRRASPGARRWPPGTLMLRFADRQSPPSCCQQPPRATRGEPEGGPVGSLQRRYLVVVLIIPVRTPLPYVAVHVEKTPRVGLLLRPPGASSPPSSL